jgi:hypothetical protein
MTDPQGRTGIGPGVPEPSVTGVLTRLIRFAKAVSRMPIFGVAPNPAAAARPREHRIRRRPWTSARHATRLCDADLPGDERTEPRVREPDAGERRIETARPAHRGAAGRAGRDHSGRRAAAYATRRRPPSRRPPAPVRRDPMGPLVMCRDIAPAAPRGWMAAHASDAPQPGPPRPPDTSPPAPRLHTAAPVPSLAGSRCRGCGAAHAPAATARREFRSSDQHAGQRPDLFATASGAHTRGPRPTHRPDRPDLPAPPSPRLTIKPEAIDHPPTRSPPDVAHHHLGRPTNADDPPTHTVRTLGAKRTRHPLPGPAYSPASVNKHLVALRQVLRECWRLGLMSAEDYQRAADLKSVEGSRLPRGHHLPGQALGAALAVCDEDLSPAGRRDAALLGVLYSTGARRAEIAGLALTDYDPAERSLRVRGRRDRGGAVVVAAAV